MKKCLYILFALCCISCSKELDNFVPKDIKEESSSLPMEFSCSNTKAVATLNTLKQEGFYVFASEYYGDYLFEFEHFDYKDNVFKSEGRYWPGNNQCVSIYSYWPNLIAYWDSHPIEGTNTLCVELDSYLNVGNSNKDNLLDDQFYNTINNSTSPWKKWWNLSYFSAKSKLASFLTEGTQTVTNWTSFLRQELSLTGNHLYYVTATIKPQSDNFPASACYLEIYDKNRPAGTYEEKYYFAQYGTKGTYAEDKISFLFKPVNTSTFEYTVGLNINNLLGPTDLDITISDTQIYDLGPRALPAWGERAAYIAKLETEYGLRDILVATQTCVCKEDTDNGKLGLEFIHPLCSISNITARLKSENPDGIITKITELKIEVPSYSYLYFPSEDYGDDYYFNTDTDSMEELNLLPMIQNDNGLLSVSTYDYSPEISNISLLPIASDMAEYSYYKVMIGWSYYKNDVSVGDYYYEGYDCRGLPGEKTILNIIVPSFYEKNKTINVDTRSDNPTQEDL